MIRIFNGLVILLLGSIMLQAADKEITIHVGSKKFTENVILGEVATLLATEAGYSVKHRKELGGTRILWNALVQDEIQVYPEYSGTILKEILYTHPAVQFSELNKILNRFGISMSAPLGFNNTYAIGMKRSLAKTLHITKISDLQKHPQLAFGFTNEFMDREDGWPGLKQKYRLRQQNVRGLDHDLAYRGLESGAVQVIDMYSTDAEIAYYHLLALEDDLGYFPEYQAVYLYRSKLKQSAPDFLKKLQQLSGTIAQSEMIQMNARAKLDKVSERAIAADFLKSKFDIQPTNETSSLWQDLWRHTRDHLILVLISLLAAILTAIPLGIIAAKFPRWGKIILSFTGVIQTIPSLALLVFMIPFLGIGGAPAIVALFLYSLLPIVRNTYSGIHDLASPLREAALALGLPAWTRLRWIEMPMASRTILAGIKTSAVINVGTATLGALIGAGGYGQPILTGIRLDDTGLILQGAIPAAVLALLVQWLFDLSEHFLVPKGLKFSPQTDR